MKKWRFIKSAPCDPYTNMAIDEAIMMTHALGHTLPTLRIYRWNPPAFSLGYFQNARRALDLKKCKKEEILFVRRMTGGGIVFHDQELAYSLTCFGDEIDAFGSVKEVFMKICLFLLNSYKTLGLNPYFSKKIRKSNLGKSGFCFASCQDYDIVIKGKKIGGNAQKRKRDLIFQHGSIPLRLKIDKFLPFLRDKPERLEEKTCSLEEVLGRKTSFIELETILKESFKETFSVDLLEQDLTAKEKDLAFKLKQEKYRTPHWNLKT